MHIIHRVTVQVKKHNMFGDIYIFRFVTSSAHTRDPN